MKPADKEKMEKLRAALTLIQNAVNELEGQRNVDFFKTVIKNKSIEIFELVTALELNEESSNLKSETETKVKTIEHVVATPETPKMVEVPKTENIPVKAEPIIEEKVIEPMVIEPEPIREKIAEPEVIAKVVEPIAEKAVEPLKIQKTEPAEEVKSKKQEAHIENESLNDRLSKNKQPAHNLVEKSKETPIADLAKSISISKKFEFINGLFDGKAEAYKACLQTIQNASNVEEAYAFLENEIANTYEWDENEKLAEEFFSLTRRRFLK
ncbi:MAG TPA: hypothetical protein VGF79_07445 [Bacteroidia bacterium]